MLIFPMKKEWFEKIERGEKTVEYREMTGYWSKRFANFVINSNESRLIQFRLGYTQKTLLAEVTEIEPMMGNDTDLKVQKMVFAIHFKLVEQ